MKKKIKDLTVAEIEKICLSQCDGCAGCPFYNSNFRECRSVIEIIDNTREVEVPE